MSLWAVIPIKPLRLGKSRLAGVLSDTDRENLNKSLLSRLIDCTQSIQEINETVIVSCDPAVLSMSRDLGVRTIQESKLTNLNNALRKATKALKSFNVNQLLILPADLPFITANDIFQIIQKITSPPEIIISPDQSKNGTNALLINPVGIIDYDFGEGSFRNHIEQAERKRVRVEIYNNDNIAFDLDTPLEIEYLRNSKELDKYLVPHQ